MKIKKVLFFIGMLSAQINIFTMAEHVDYIQTHGKPSLFVENGTSGENAALHRLKFENFLNRQQQNQQRVDSAKNFVNTINIDQNKPIDFSKIKIDGNKNNESQSSSLLSIDRLNQSLKNINVKDFVESKNKSTGSFFSNLIKESFDNKNLQNNTKNTIDIRSESPKSVVEIDSLGQQQEKKQESLQTIEQNQDNRVENDSRDIIAQFSNRNELQNLAEYDKGTKLADYTYAMNSENSVDMITHNEYTVQGDIATQVIRNGAGQKIQEKIYNQDGSYQENTYDQSGQILHEIQYNARGVMTEDRSLTYDDQHQVTTIMIQSYGSKGLIQKSFSVDFQSQEMMTRQFKNGAIQEVFTTLDGKPIKFINYSLQNKPINAIEYNEQGNVVRKITYAADGVKILRAVDGANRPLDVRAINVEKQLPSVNASKLPEKRLSVVRQVLAKESDVSPEMMRLMMYAVVIIPERGFDNNIADVVAKIESGRYTSIDDINQRADEIFKDSLTKTVAQKKDDAFKIVTDTFEL